MGLRTAFFQYLPTPKKPAPTMVVKHFGACTIFDTGRTDDRMIAGVASTPAINAHGYSLASAGCEIQLPIPLLSAHGRVGPMGTAPRYYQGDQRSIAIGEVVYARRTPQEIYIRAVLFRDRASEFAWKLIEAGETLAFSGAGKDMRTAGVVDGIRFYDRWTMCEVSVCRTGACPGALLDHRWIRT